MFLIFTTGITYSVFFSNVFTVYSVMYYFLFISISLLPAMQYSLLKELKEMFPLKTKESSSEDSSVSITIYK